MQTIRAKPVPPPCAALPLAATDRGRGPVAAKAARGDVAAKAARGDQTAAAARGDHTASAAQGDHPAPEAACLGGLAQDALAWPGGAALRIAPPGGAGADAASASLVATRPLLLRLCTAGPGGWLRLAGAGCGAGLHLLAPGEALEARLSAGARGLLLALDPAAFGPGGAPARGETGLRDPLIEALLDGLAEACAEGSAPSAAAVGQAVAARLGGRGGAPAGLQPWRLRRVRAHVDAKLAEPITLAELAAAAGLSPFHFARGFARATGMTPFAWLRRRRCAEARQLMVTTTLRLSDVATRCGFRSQSHFTSVFQQVEGLPPGRWRALAAGQARQAMAPRRPAMVSPQGDRQEPSPAPALPAAGWPAAARA